MEVFGGSSYKYINAAVSMVQKKCDSFRILLDDFGIGGVPATVAEGGNGFEVRDLLFNVY